jgi:hypothetical protein
MEHIQKKDRAELLRMMDVETLDVDGVLKYVSPDMTFVL